MNYLLSPPLAFLVLHSYSWTYSWSKPGERDSWVPSLKSTEHKNQNSRRTVVFHVNDCWCSCNDDEICCICYICWSQCLPGKVATRIWVTGLDADRSHGTTTICGCAAKFNTKINLHYKWQRILSAPQDPASAWSEKQHACKLTEVWQSNRKDSSWFSEQCLC